MKCWLCKKNNAKKINKIWTDDLPKNWLKKPNTISWHYVCNSCFKEVMQSNPDGEW